MGKGKDPTDAPALEEIVLIRDEVKEQIPYLFRGSVGAFGEHYSIEQWSSVTAVAKAEQFALLHGQLVQAVMTSFATTEQMAKLEAAEGGREAIEVELRQELAVARAEVKATEAVLVKYEKRAYSAEVSAAWAKKEMLKAEEKARLSNMSSGLAEAGIEIWKTKAQDFKDKHVGLMKEAAAMQAKIEELSVV